MASGVVTCSRPPIPAQFLLQGSRDGRRGPALPERALGDILSLRFLVPSTHRWREQTSLFLFFFPRPIKKRFFSEQAISYYGNSKQESEPGRKWSVLIRTLKYFNAYTLYFCELDYIAF